MSHAEIHFHLLPGIDDGPLSIEETVALAAAAAADGTRTIVATPHVHPVYDTDVRTLPSRVDKVRARLAEERIPIDVRCGAEIAHSMVGRVSDPELETIAHGPVGRRWVLLEAPLAGLEDDYTLAADEIRERGFGVVVAHPERSMIKTGEVGWRVIEHELAAGSAVQINAWSVAGLYGERMRTTALSLLRRAPRAVIASDAHGGPRMPALGMALDALAANGVADPLRFVDAGPRELLEQGLAPSADSLAA
jgi:protein-tyrosine phosphatase